MPSPQGALLPHPSLLSLQRGETVSHEKCIIHVSHAEHGMSSIPLVGRPSTAGEIQVYEWSYDDYRKKYNDLWRQSWRLKFIQTYSPCWLSMLHKELESNCGNASCAAWLRHFVYASVRDVPTSIASVQCFFFVMHHLYCRLHHGR
jgi:hypothetical protein